MSINIDELEELLLDVWRKASQLQHELPPREAYKSLFEYIDRKWLIAKRKADKICVKCGDLGVKNGLGESGKCDCVD